MSFSIVLLQSSKNRHNAGYPAHLYTTILVIFDIYDHRLKNSRHPVRSTISKLQIARLVLRWVTTRESLPPQHIYQTSIFRIFDFLFR
ncbi:hypothetical protein L211DRAFT_789294 [Terfezia boudieri ATCC MYA-4762]|uniref:Uncharacterized protein n=1 Tax=Terfezia boudieri ATCC MYA-4762 TaxID=1051890 RepID=A0A3N4LGZ6_9PEZI|nr:hypothetical protein L211DRAFT_789294 [Terfezia boudieri ATCC MYA-4762]